MKQKNKPIYQELLVEIKWLEADLIRTSDSIAQTEVGISWKENWSSNWES